jgi:hypothetical protein
MENRDRDKMSDPSEIEKNENDSESEFGQNIGRSEDWKDEPSRKSGSEGMKGDNGGLGSSEDIESGGDLGSSRGYGESGNVNRGSSSSTEH